MKQQRFPKIDEFLVKRWTRAGGQQSKGAPCIICKKSFDDCPHSFVDIDKVSSAIETGKMLGLLK